MRLLGEKRQDESFGAPISERENPAPAPQHPPPHESLWPQAIHPCPAQRSTEHRCNDLGDVEGTGPGWQQEPLGWCSRPSHWPLVPNEIVQGAAGRPVILGCVSMKRWGGDVVAGLCPCAPMALRGCPVSEHESPTMNRRLLFPEQPPRRQQEGILRVPPTRSPPSSPPRPRPHRCQGCRSWPSPPPRQPRCSPPSSSKIKMKICSVGCRMGPTPKRPHCAAKESLLV